MAIKRFFLTLFSIFSVIPAFGDEVSYTYIVYRESFTLSAFNNLKTNGRQTDRQPALMTNLAKGKTTYYWLLNVDRRLPVLESSGKGKLAQKSTIRRQGESEDRLIETFNSEPDAFWLNVEVSTP